MHVNMLSLPDIGVLGLVEFGHWLMYECVHCSQCSVCMQGGGLAGVCHRDGSLRRSQTPDCRSGDAATPASMPLR